MNKNSSNRTLFGMCFASSSVGPQFAVGPGEEPTDLKTEKNRGSGVQCMLFPYCRKVAKL